MQNKCPLNEINLEKSFSRFYEGSLVIPHWPAVLLIFVGLSDLLFFIFRTNIFGPSFYNDIHFLITPITILLTLTFLVNGEERDIFLRDFCFWFLGKFPFLRSFVFRKWFLILLHTGGLKMYRYFWAHVILLLDGSFIILKILFFSGCTIYARIHFAIVVLAWLWIRIACIIFYKQIDIYKNLKELALRKRPLLTGIMTEQHPYHMLPPSALPILTSYFIFDFLFFNVKYLHYGLTYYIATHLILSFVGLVGTLSFWFLSIHNEAAEGHHTKRVRWNMLHAFVLFIVSEIMLFFSIFWAFFHSSLSPSVAIYCMWPPLGIEVIQPFGLPFLNTVILLSSGVSLTFAHKSLTLGRVLNVSCGLLITIGYGILFTFVQVFEYINSSFSINDGIYGSVFFFSTGFHGLHVLIGTIMLIVALVRNGLRQLLATQHVGFIASAWYWHFVDVVWLFLFICIYWWGS